MDIEKIISEMTFEEKAKFLTGAESMGTFALERFGVDEVKFADGPHGVRHTPEENCTHFPNLCNLGSSWNVETARKMGRALADECIEHGVNMLLGPGINIKRNILCGRNFEYISEDPVLAGQIAAGYIEGLQEKGVSASLKHFAANSIEEQRVLLSAEIDERTLREIYLKGFEIAVKKAKPDSVMCAYNKVNAVWCSENKFLLQEVLKDDWGYEGMVVSDWGAVQDISRSIAAGLDLQMPTNPDIVKELREGLDNGLVTMEEIDEAVRRMLRFADRKPLKKGGYDRDKQHRIAQEIAADGVVLIKNNNNVLPITKDKYKKITVVGEYAASPLIGGQGSAEVYPSVEYTDSPLQELKKRLPDVEIDYMEIYKKGEYFDSMLWHLGGEFKKGIKDSDLVLFFAGSMVSEDTECLDRRTAYINQNFESFMCWAQEENKKVAVVLQNGGALIFGHYLNNANAIMEMWLAGEGAGGAVADVLCGNINPSGKLSETFPNRMRTDLGMLTNGLVLEYKERFDVGYRYYDKHPEEINYPFGHGLSYTSFEYKDITVSLELEVEFTLKNTGDVDGAEVVQLYVGDPVSTVIRPIKELKKFQKVFLNAGEEKKVKFKLSPEDLAYYNVSLHDWTVENGRYDIYIGSSSRDIRLTKSVMYCGRMKYSIQKVNDSMIG